MAGNYPNVPGPRMAYHRDGTAGVLIFNGTPSSLSAGELQALNDENNSTNVVWTNDNWIPARTYVLIFPELRDINGIVISAHSTSGLSGLETSTDTTNGQDGNWSALGGYAMPNSTGWTSAPSYRTSIGAVSANGVKAVRFTLNGTGSAAWHQFSGWHVYGKPSSGETRYLMFTDTGNVEVGGAYFDFADDPRGGNTEDKAFKVRNGHGTLTANTVTVSFSALTDKSPSFADDYTFSSDGSSYSSSLNLGNLAAGASSGTLYVRRTTPSGAVLGLETGIITASAASWS